MLIYRINTNFLYANIKLIAVDFILIIEKALKEEISGKLNF